MTKLLFIGDGAAVGSDMEEGPRVAGVPEREF